MNLTLTVQGTSEDADNKYVHCDIALPDGSREHVSIIVGEGVTFRITPLNPAIEVAASTSAGLLKRLLP